MKSKFPLLTLLAMMILLGCEKAKYDPNEIADQEAQISELAQKELDRKYEQYRTRIAERCRKEAIEIAIKYVDSIIVEELNLTHLDHIKIPRKPTRPKLPEGIIVNDSTDIGPK